MKYKHLKTLGITAAISFAAAGAAFYGSQVTAQAAAAGNKGSRDAGGRSGGRSAAAGSAAKAGGRSANTGDPGAAMPAMGMLASLAGLLSILKRRKEEEA